MGLFKKILSELLCESVVSPIDIDSVMDKHHRVIISYHTEGKDEHTGPRVIEIYAYGQDKNGRDVIRAFEPYGDTTSKVPHWKFFRLDRISSWKETEQTFVEPPDPKYGKFNPEGDKSMSLVYKVTSFGETETPNVDNATNPKGVTMAKTSGDIAKERGQRTLDLLQHPITLDDLKTKNAVDNGDDTQTSDKQSSGPKLNGTEMTDAETQKQSEIDTAWQELERRKKMDARNMRDRERRWQKRADTTNLVHDDTAEVLKDIEDKEKKRKEKEYLNGDWTDQNAETADESIKRVLSLMERIERL